jgi:hypothetical protein
LSSVYLIIDKQKWLSYNIKKQNANTAGEKNDRKRYDNEKTKDFSVYRVGVVFWIM